MSTSPPPESPSRDQAILEILQLAAPIMEAYAPTHQLHEWHCRLEDLIGTAYPTVSRTNDPSAGTGDTGSRLTGQ